MELNIVCGITSESSKVIDENMKYFRKLIEINLYSKFENKKGNIIEDAGFIVLFNNAKYLSHLEMINCEGKKDKKRK